MSEAVFSTLAAIRFGFGRDAAGHAPDAATLLDGLFRPDGMDARHPVARRDRVIPLIDRFVEARQAMRDDPALTPAFDAADRDLRAIKIAVRDAVFLRGLDTPQPFRERLVHFWADHFSIRLPGGPMAALLGDYVYAAIGHNIIGRFADMLKAVATHPMMLDYLDQQASVGPNSRIGKTRGRGLNENYARELLELHTLGVGGGYGQADVRQLAELLAGMRHDRAGTFAFRPGLSEPGAEHVLGRSYGDDGPGTLGQIYALLEDLSVHPDTARHMAKKLCVHFLGDPADPAAVEALAAAWRQSGGALPAVYDALVHHAAARDPALRKVKTPFEYLMSCCRALGVGSAPLQLRKRGIQRHLRAPARLMGQDMWRAPGPDGWPEAPEAWITPQGLSSRIRWALSTPGQVLDTLPDPRDFVATALGPVASRQLVWAAGAAESRAQGVGLVLAAPGFIRR